MKKIFKKNIELMNTKYYVEHRTNYEISMLNEDTVLNIWSFVGYNLCYELGYNLKSLAENNECCYQKLYKN